MTEPIATLPCWQDHNHYPNSYLRAILTSIKSIAMIGVSPDASRPSHFAMRYLQARGYRIYPVNPITDATKILGETVYSNLSKLPCTVDMVDIFRNSKAAGPLTNDAIEHQARVVWMQLGVMNLEAARQAEKCGLRVIMNRCPKIEYSRLRGELSWFGINSQVLSSQLRPFNDGH